MRKKEEREQKERGNERKMIHIMKESKMIN